MRFNLHNILFYEQIDKSSIEKPMSERKIVAKYDTIN